MDATRTDDTLKYPSTTYGGLSVKRLPGQGAGGIRAEGDIDAEGAIRAMGAELVGAFYFGSPDCATTIRGSLVVDGEITGPSISERFDLRAPPSTWVRVPAATRDRLVHIFAESGKTTAAFVAVRGTEAINTLIRTCDPDSPAFLALKCEQEEFFVAYVEYQSARTGSKAEEKAEAGREYPTGIAGAIRSTGDSADEADGSGQVTIRVKVL